MKRQDSAAFLLLGVIEMGVPQILMIIIYTLNILIAILQHGKLETTIHRHNALYDILVDAIIISILYAGGFWSQ